MCGLVGVVGDISDKGKRAFIDMLIFDSVRGVDSTGVLFVPKGEMFQPLVTKAVGDPFQLMDTNAFNSEMKGSHRVLMGHNRYSTVGKTTRANAHPFEIGDLIGAHNGTLTNKHALHKGHMFDVDSQALYNHINEKGLKDAIGIAQGAWALTWWDKKNSRINFLRNKERPLHFAMSTDQKMLFWASEHWMIEVACSRNGVPIVDGEAKMFLEDNHFSYRICGLGDRHDYIAEEVKGSPAPFVITGGGGRNFNNYTHEKKKQPTVVPFKRARDDSLVGTKGMRFQAIGIGSDANGGRYLSLLVEGHEADTFRVYMNKKDDLDGYKGKWFTGDVQAYMTPNGADVPHGYYKISYGTLRLVKTYKDHNGEDISSTDFYTRYGQCTWCNSAVFPEEDKHKFDSDGNVFCKDCVTDNEVLQYCKLLK